MSDPFYFIGERDVPIVEQLTGVGLSAGDLDVINSLLVNLVGNSYGPLMSSPSEAKRQLGAAHRQTLALAKALDNVSPLLRSRAFGAEPGRGKRARRFKLELKRLAKGIDHLAKLQVYRHSAPRGRRSLDFVDNFIAGAADIFAGAGGSPCANFDKTGEIAGPFPQFLEYLWTLPSLRIRTLPVPSFKRYCVGPVTKLFRNGASRTIGLHHQINSTYQDTIQTSYVHPSQRRTIPDEAQHVFPRGRHGFPRGI